MFDIITRAIRSLNSLKEFYGDYIGEHYRGFLRGDPRSSDYGSHSHVVIHMVLF